MTDNLKVILEARVGSKLYNLDTPESDNDYLGVFMYPITELVGLIPPKETFVTNEPNDRTLHEIGKFCRLCLSANPTVTELLWAPVTDLTTHHIYGEQLRQRRELFLSTDTVRNSYGGYALQQVERFIKRGGKSFSSDTSNRTKKHARHCIRLMWQGHELLTTGNLTLKLTPEQREECFYLGEMAVSDPDMFVALYEVLDKQLFSADSVLLDKPDKEAINELLIDIRMDDLANSR
jgi:uncharacterized protein